MPTEKPRLSLAVSDELKKQINDYQYSHRSKNQSQAIISLIKRGVESVNQDQNPSVPPPDILYISRPTGNPATDDLRKYLHGEIDQMDDDDLKLFRDISIRMRRE